MLVFLNVPTFLEMTGLNPINDQLSVHGHGSMLQAFDDREVRIGKVGVLANHGDVNLFCEGVEMMRHGLSTLQEDRGRAIQPFKMSHNPCS